MNAKLLRLIALMMFAGCLASASAASFVNLNFESATVVVNDPTFGFLDWNLAVPGWSHSPGSDSGHVYYYSAHLGNSGYFLLVDANSPYYAPGTQLAGNYSLGLRAGHLLSYDQNSPWQDAYISQTGSISASVHSLQMLATGPFEVLINGTHINMQLQSGNLYAGDISAFAGTTSELRIVNSTFTEARVDNIQFSITAVPEPGCVGLVSVGLIALANRRAPRPARRRRSQC